MEISLIKMQVSKKKNLRSPPQQLQDNHNSKDNKTKKTFQSPHKPSEQSKIINQKVKANFIPTNQK